MFSMNRSHINWIAHDLGDSSKWRSRDVVIEESVSFKDMLLSHKTFFGLSKCGFKQPSPIQLATIPLGRCGFDLIVQSKAGTGKTCIFALVALEALQFNPGGCSQTLIIAPTREIATQIEQVISLMGQGYNDLRCALCIGGVEVKQDRLKFGNPKANDHKACQIIIGTPGRVRQLIELGVIKTQYIEIFVLDEADKLMDVQFKSQIDEIYKRLPKDKQMIVTSATYPDELSSFLEQYMRAPKSVRLGKDLSLDALKELFVKSRAGHSKKKTIENKCSTLKKLLNKIEFTKCLIFTNFQARAPIICDSINEDELFVIDYGLTNYLSAELSQEGRNKVFGKFKNSDQKILVSTDISARGIDIDGIQLVINFDLPMDSTTYYHRIGRAGRFGQLGVAISIVSGESEDQIIFKDKMGSHAITELLLE